MKKLRIRVVGGRGRSIMMLKVPETYHRSDHPQGAEAYIDRTLLERRGPFHAFQEAAIYHKSMVARFNDIEAKGNGYLNHVAAHAYLLNLITYFRTVHPETA